MLRVPAREGDYVHVVAGQGARDVALTLTGPGGRTLRVDSASLTETHLPPEEVHWVADAPGELRLEVALLQGPSGPCPMRVAARRPANAADRERALAEGALARAHELRRTREAARCRAAVAPYQEAARRFAGLGLPRRRAEALLGLGLLQRDCLRDGAAALPAFAEVASLLAGEGEAEGNARQNLGELRFALGDLDGAIGEYRRALALRRRRGDRPAEALTASTLGHALHLRGRYDEAAAQLDRALSLWRESDDPVQRAKTQLNRGQLDRTLGEAERARGRFRAALALSRQARDRGLQAVALNALGLLLQEQGQHGAALPLLAEARDLRPPGSRGQAVTLTTLGVSYRELRRPDDARRVYEQALAIYRQVGDAREEARALGNLGWLEAGARRDEAALADFDRARALYEKLADPPDLAWVLWGKAGVERRRRDLAAARRTMEEVLALVERHRFGQKSYTTRAAFFGTQQDLYDYLIDLLMEMHRAAPAAGYAAAALEASERALARSLLDRLAAGGTPLRRGTAPELLARERALERAIDALVDRQTRLAEGEAGAAQLRPVEEALARRWAELDRVRAELRAGDPRYFALTQPQPWKAVEIQRRLLDRDTLLLEYRLGEKRSFLWAVTRDSLASFELPGRAEIEPPARLACDQLARSRARQIESAAQLQLAKLGPLLLGPVARLLPGKRLLVVGDGALQSLPFAALPEPGGDGPLVARHEIVSLPSVSVLGELRREAAGRKPAPKTLWVLADPDFGPRFPPLPYTRQEAVAILALTPAGSRFALLGRQASRAAVLGGRLRDYRLLHFATHGSFAATDPGGGRLVLAQLDARGRPVANGFLHLSDIYDLDLAADLVVLSACQSALGREVRGEGLMGMTRGFFYAGAERVLVSLWNVNDRATVELMQRFYRGVLQEGLSPAAALRAAQDAVRRQPRWRAPFYWAGFTLRGDWAGMERTGLAGAPASP